jgi:hypothetical protein
MPGYNLGGAPTQVYSAPTSVTFNAPATVQVFNQGSSPLWLGNAGVTQNNGLQLNPGAHFRIVNMFTSLYAVGGAVATATHSALAASCTAGTTNVNVTSNASFTAGVTFVIGNTVSSQEVLTVASTTSTTVITTTTTVQYDHLSGETVATATVTGAQIQVIPGVL